MPNTTAYAALLVWPLISLMIFATQPIARAIVICVFGSYLFLPSRTAIDLPALPAMDKVALANLVMLLLALTFSNAQTGIVPKSKVAKYLLIIVLAAPIATAIRNPDPILYGSRYIAGLTIYDSISIIASTFLTIVPFLIGRSFLGSVDGHRLILRTIIAFGIFYSFLMLLEIRLSPQLHTWVYGFFPHSFSQQIRSGGFRPVVFLEHGLSVAFFAMTVTVASATLWRSAKDKARMSLAIAMGYFGTVLILCKSLGSLIYGSVLVPLILLTTPRNHLLVATFLAFIAVLYPILRGADLVPTETFVEIARGIDADRAQSLQFRFYNEDILLERANERPVLGWGTWGRNRVYDPETGQDLSVTDGFWVIVIGSFGWVGYLSIFGLLAWSIVSIWQVGRKTRLNLTTTSLGLLLAINMIELLPNATFFPWTWLIAGALLGYGESATNGEKVDLGDKQESPNLHPRTIL